MDNIFTIYILELESGKYYIGRTCNLEKRYKDHLLGKGSSYTKKYPPIKIKETFDNKSRFDEDRYVIEYMHIYGIDNVRGGCYSMVNLSEIEKYAIKRKIWGAMDLCFVCGRKHFSIRCDEETDVYGDEIKKCKRCLRKGHLGYECVENKNIFQKNIRKSPDDFLEETDGVDKENVKDEEDFVIINNNEVEEEIINHQSNIKQCCVIS